MLTRAKAKETGVAPVIQPLPPRRAKKQPILREANESSSPTPRELSVPNSPAPSSAPLSAPPSPQQGPRTTSPGNPPVSMTAPLDKQTTLSPPTESPTEKTLPLPLPPPSGNKAVKRGFRISFNELKKQIEARQEEERKVRESEAKAAEASKQSKANSFIRIRRTESSRFTLPSATTVVQTLKPIASLISSTLPSLTGLSTPTVKSPIQRVEMRPEAATETRPETATETRQETATETLPENTTEMQPETNTDCYVISESLRTISTTRETEVKNPNKVVLRRARKSMPQIVSENILREDSNGVANEERNFGGIHQPENSPCLSHRSADASETFFDCVSPLTIQVPEGNTSTSDTLHETLASSEANSLPDPNSCNKAIVQRWAGSIDPAFSFPVATDMLWERSKNARPKEECLLAWSFDNQALLNISHGTVKSIKKRAGVGKLSMSYEGIVGHMVYIYISVRKWSQQCSTCYYYSHFILTQSSLRQHYPRDSIHFSFSYRLSSTFS